MKTPHTPGPWSIEIRKPEYCYATVQIRSSKYRRSDSQLNKYICGMPDQTGEDEPLGFCKRKNYYDDPIDAAQNMANARLIASAPELLDALNAAYNALAWPDDEMTDEEEEELLESIRAALRKAKGEA